MLVKKEMAKAARGGRKGEIDMSAVGKYMQAAYARDALWAREKRAWFFACLRFSWFFLLT